MDRSIIITEDIIHEINLLIDEGFLMIDNDGYVVETKHQESGIEIYPTFNDFWDKYAKKINADKCQKKWNKLSRKVKLQIMQHLEVYIKATPDKQYRKHPMTYLNNKSWNDEVIRKELQKKLGYTNIDRAMEFFDNLKNGNRNNKG